MRPRLVLFVLLAWLSLAAAAQTPAKRPMTFEDLMQMRRLGATDVSSDGKWLIYTATDVDLAKNTKTPRIWLQAIAGGDPVALAAAQPGDDSARFSLDGKQVLFTSSRGGSQQIYIASFDLASGQSGEPKQVTRISTEADGAIWSPDGSKILFTSAVYPDCPAITETSTEGDTCNKDRDAAKAESKVKARIFDHLLYRHWNAFTGDKRSHMFLLTLATGALRDLNPNDPHDVPPFSLGGGQAYNFAPDSKELAFTENLDEEPAISTNADIFTLDLTNPAAKPVKVSTSPGGDFTPAYSPDGKYLAWRSQARAGYESDKFRLMVWDRISMFRTTQVPRNLLPKFDNWVDEFVWAPDSRSIVFLSGTNGESGIYSVSLAEPAVISLAPGAHDAGEYSGLMTLGEPDHFIASRMTVAQPGEVVKLVPSPAIVEGKNQKGEFGPTTSPLEPLPITHLNDALLGQLDLAPLESFSFPAADKTKVQGFLIKPPAFDPAKKYPVKFLIHGGPQGAWGDSWSYRWNAELLAANGYVVVMVNPRGSTGYGQAFVDGVNGDWGGKPFTDLMLGLDYAEKTYPFIDKSRECALGASYGGYMANWVLGHTNRFKCIVTHDGMFDPESAYGDTEELWFNEWEFKGKPWDYYGKPDSENPYRRWSPALSAKNFKTPTLVIHSQLDYRLDVSEGYQLFTTLQRLKVPSRMLYFPDEGHWVQKPQNSELWYKTVNAWVDQWTRSGP